MIEIKNLKTDRMTEKFDMRVDRKSPVGNPEYMTATKDRDYVCDVYEMYFRRQMAMDDDFRAYVESLIRIYKRHHRLRLFCWCAPKRCHAETIKAYIERQV